MTHLWINLKSSYDIVTFVSRYLMTYLRINLKTISVNLGPWS